ncbi:MAG: hypothetical protein KA712_25735 [Myxococcales bacterium]|nr:hypothetical protein [Myxococcales bacterium]
MLDPWIIEQIRRRESEERRRREQPVLELPLPEPDPDAYERPVSWPGEPQPERGVVIIGM